MPGVLSSSAPSGGDCSLKPSAAHLRLVHDAVGSGSQHEQHVVSTRRVFGEIEFDPTNRCVLRNGVPVRLTRRQLDLTFLVLRRRRPFLKIADAGGHRINHSMPADTSVHYHWYAAPTPNTVPAPPPLTPPFTLMFSATRAVNPNATAE